MQWFITSRTVMVVTIINVVKYAENNIVQKKNIYQYGKMLHYSMW